MNHAFDDRFAGSDNPCVGFGYAEDLFRKQRVTAAPEDQGSRSRQLDPAYEIENGRKIGLGSQPIHIIHIPKGYAHHVGLDLEDPIQSGLAAIGQKVELDNVVAVLLQSCGHVRHTQGKYGVGESF